ncbi:MAG: protein-export chaperone SecB [Gammaproteobacteria bacterium]|nr:protein-export chaperone SecB [Gammaproteobacteria bacterium]MDH3559342.1 protein-export chaperone SecB [Gammaproteobacteria bacterium]
MADEAQPATLGDNGEKAIIPQKVYLKDVSLETPNSPDIFTREWKPQLGIEIDNQVASVAEDTWEVVLSVTATVKVGEATAFLAEVHQAGIFTLKGFEPERLQRLHNVYCLRTLYPFACAALSDLVTKGGFPQLVLAPMNFEALYEKRLQQAQADEAGSAQH